MSSRSLASDFAPPPRRTFSVWERYAWSVPLYGLGVPLVKVLDAAGVWPRVIASAAKRTVGSFDAYEPTAADVFVCAGFKAGTTWMLQIATQIAFRGAAEFANIHNVVPWPDGPPMFQWQMIPLANPSPRERAPTGLRVIKTHGVQRNVPYSPAARYIAVVRDPKDVIVSGYHFLRSLLYGPLMPSVNHWIDLNLAGQVPHGEWADHLAGYWSVRDRGNVLFLTYEETKRGTDATVSKVAQFMGVDLSERELATVVQAASFECMKRDQSKFDPGQVVPWSARDFMLRKGRAGSSSELLTQEMQDRIDDHCRADLRRR
ncbi:MAG: sulfotransferase domain-containing protein, partial [Gammaproteobacteria bacterium]